VHGINHARICTIGNRQQRATEHIDALTVVLAPMAGDQHNLSPILRERNQPLFRARIRFEPPTNMQQRINHGVAGHLDSRVMHGFAQQILPSHRCWREVQSREQTDDPSIRLLGPRSC
jgi:hypothetical protein